VASIAPVPSEPPPSPAAENRRVLIVDDNPDVSADFRKILGGSSGMSQEMRALEADLFGTPTIVSTSDFELDFASQGQEALGRIVRAVADDRPYSVVFMDVRMPPGWDGVKTTQHVLDRDPNVAIVICTAYADYNSNQLAQVFGQTDRVLVLKKPFDPVEVRQLAHALRRRWELDRAANFHLEKLDVLVNERTEKLSSALSDLRREQKLRERMETQVRLSQKLEAVGQLAAGIAHEINTPLQYIGDHVDFLESAFKDLSGLLNEYRTECEAAEKVERSSVYKKLRRYEKRMDTQRVEAQIPRAFEQALHGIDRIGRTVRAMKEFSYRDSSEVKSTDLNRVVQNALTVSRNEYKHLAELKTTFAELPPVECRAGQIGQAVLNLIVNAASAIDDSGRPGIIHVATTTEGDDTALITITDNGCGIPDLVRGRIFDPFFTTKEVGRGTGQGLTIAHAVVVDGHDGRLTFETSNEGTTFFLRLPIRGPSVQNGNGNGNGNGTSIH
jgi:two-component system, NtrC family, sensor kinase